MFICKPERSPKQAKILLLICVVVTTSLFLLSSFPLPFASLFNMSGFLALMASLLLNVRYSLTEYEYSVSGGDFSVTRITGNRRQVVCCIALETAVDLMPKKDYKNLPSNEKGIIKYSLNQNIKAESFVFLCEFNGKRTMIEFEPNGAFVSILKDEIAKAKHSTDIEE